jgi:tRNA(adenine34) deaminase
MPMLIIVKMLRRRLRSEFFNISGKYRNILYILEERRRRLRVTIGERRFSMDEQRAQDEQFMRQALELAREAERAGEVPVGAVLAIDGKVIGRGRNSPVEFDDPTAHAEILALREAAAALGNYRVERATLYSTLEPCVMCAGALVAARVERLVFGARDLRFGGVRSKFRVADSELLNHRVEVVEGVLGAECAELMLRFFNARR